MAKFYSITLCRKTPYSQFHKTLPITSLQIHWISVRFYEMGYTQSHHYLSSISSDNAMWRQIIRKLSQSSNRTFQHITGHFFTYKTTEKNCFSLRDAVQCILHIIPYSIKIYHTSIIQTYVHVYVIYIYIQSISRTLPEISLQIHWISVRFYEMGCICFFYFRSHP